MLTPDERLSIGILFDAGFSIADISRKTGRSIGTIQKYKKIQQYNGRKEESSETSISSKINPVKDIILSRIKTGRVNVVKLYRQLKIEGYQGSYSLLNKYVVTHRIKEKYYKPSQSVDHRPGEQAQMDWGSFGKITINGRVKRLYAFLYVLSYSRAMYVEFTVRQNRETLEGCHKRAFQKLGIPKAIRYDNMKPVVARIERKAGEIITHINPEFKNFADHYGFNIETCPPYWGRAKGKVESAVKYLRYNFMIDEIFGKTFYDLEEINEKVRQWVNDIANLRNHRKTKERPIDLWQKERELLIFPNNIPNYSTRPFIHRRSNKDALVTYNNNLYEVPYDLGQKKLFVRETEHRGIPKLEIYKGDLLVYTHDIPEGEQGKIVAMSEPRSSKPGKDARKIRVRKSELTKRLDKIKVPDRNLNYYDNLIGK